MAPDVKKLIWKSKNLTEARRFVGRLETAEWIESKFKGPDGETREQLQFQVTPLDHKIKGDTGMYHEWFNPTSQKRSKWGVLVEALEKLGVEIEGDGTELAGMTFEWEEKIMPWKAKNPDTNEEKEVKVLVPVALIQQEEPVKKTAGLIKKAPTVKVAVSANDWSGLHAILKNGVEADALQSTILRWAQRNKVSKEDLNKHMEEIQEKLVQEEDGTVSLPDA